MTKEVRGRDNVGSQDFGLRGLMGTFKGSVRSHYDLVLLAYQLQFVFNDCLSDRNTELSERHTETAPEHNCSRGPGVYCIPAPAVDIALNKLWQNEWVPGSNKGTVPHGERQSWVGCSPPVPTQMLTQSPVAPQGCGPVSPAQTMARSPMAPRADDGAQSHSPGR